ncbi:MAG TPA: glycosyltransferase family 39 protein, partial [Anaerolineales bacterium]|nr:glycosyltransferase family 39 protein [Anaerolineales bacterium]
MKHKFVAALVVILLLATGLRFYRLDAQSFWNDEGNTARLVERPVALIIEGAAGDIHPPGYYLLLHVWRAFTGESEFALRAFSALCGVLTVAVTAAIGYRVGGRRTALAAALFVAVHPLSVYYSQEARMYALLGLASVLTLLCSLKLKVESSKFKREASRVENPKSKIQNLFLLLAFCIA